MLPYLQLWSVKDTPNHLPGSQAGYFRSGSNTTPAALTDLPPPQTVGCRSSSSLPRQACFLSPFSRETMCIQKNSAVVRLGFFRTPAAFCCSQEQQQTALTKSGGYSPAMQTLRGFHGNRYPTFRGLNCLIYVKTHLTQSSLSTQLRADKWTNTSAIANIFRTLGALLFHTTRDALL